MICDFMKEIQFLFDNKNFDQFWVGVHMPIASFRPAIHRDMYVYNTIMIMISLLWSLLLYFLFLIRGVQ